MIDDLAEPLTSLARHEPNDPIVLPRGPWTYDSVDSAIVLFTAAVTRFHLTFPPGCRILELGCAETDWLERMHAWDASFDLVGVDTREQQRKTEGFDLRIGDAMNPLLFAPDSFDRIVMLGALEHFGLGFYGDPVQEAGDVQTMHNIASWLTQDGLVYFDVPYQPTYRVASNRHFRMYDAGALVTRLLEPSKLLEVNRGYSLPEPHAGTWCHQPTEERVPYWYVAVVAQKVSA